MAAEFATLLLLLVIGVNLMKESESMTTRDSNFISNASSACNTPILRIARDLTQNLPCNFSRDSWCTIAGNNYPWQAIRKFIQENQGLMKRMYGDEKYIDVLKTELENNGVELELEDEQNEQYNEDTSRSLYMQFPFEVDSESGARFPKVTDPSLSNGTTSEFEPIKNAISEQHSKDTSNATYLTSSAAPPEFSTLSSSTYDPRTPFTTSMPSVILSKVDNLDINKISGQIDVPELINLSEITTTFHPEEEQVHFRPRPEYKPIKVTSTSTSLPESMGSQFFQDVVAKDKQQESPTHKSRGISVCPVKEEVVAPFWANNTRGELLALLNIYPFEQYIHWEKCMHEDKQMYCRDGCRCEQQYRLHRLLAYDPNNECRGIFSDWFRFPNCCTCRCYDLPLEFQITSRSPRNHDQKQKLKVRAPRQS